MESSQKHFHLQNKFFKNFFSYTFYRTSSDGKDGSPLETGLFWSFQRVGDGGVGEETSSILMHLC